MTRRACLINIIKSFFTLVAVGAVSTLWYIYPSTAKKRRLQYVFVFNEEELPKRGVRKVEFKYFVEGNEIINRAFLVVGETGLIFYSPVCTHLGCYINWDNNRKEFLCPCHGGRYNIEGQVIAGPPPKPLNRLPFKIEEGKVYLGVTV